jgi:hypothetical protein
LAWVTITCSGERNCCIARVAPRPSKDSDGSHEDSREAAREDSRDAWPGCRVVVRVVRASLGLLCGGNGGDVGGINPPNVGLLGLDGSRKRNLVRTSGCRLWIAVSKNGAENCTSGVWWTAAAFWFRTRPGSAGEVSNCCSSKFLGRVLRRGAGVSTGESAVVRVLVRLLASPSVPRVAFLLPALLALLVCSSGCESGMVMSGTLLLPAGVALLVLVFLVLLEGAIVRRKNSMILLTPLNCCCTGSTLSRKFL